MLPLIRSNLVNPSHVPAVRIPETCQSSVAFGRLGTAFVIAAALSAGALTSNCALAASDDGWFSAIDAGRGEKKAGPHVTVDIIAEKPH